MKLYFRPVILMEPGGDEPLIPPGTEGSLGGGDGGWDPEPIGGDKSAPPLDAKSVDVFAAETSEG